MNKKSLKNLGLTETEINIYLTLFELGSSLASKISKKANVERSLTYQILNSLVNRGLVSCVIKENIKYFNSVNPNKLLDLVEEEESKLQEQKQGLRLMIKELKTLKIPETEVFNIEVYKGVEGFKTVMNDILKEKEDYFIIGYTARSTEIAKYWYAHWNNKRVKQKIKRYLLIPKIVKKEEALRFPLTVTKELPPKYIAPSKSSTIVYGKDKVLIFLPMKKDFSGIIIKNKEIHNSYKDFFNILWKQGK